MKSPLPDTDIRDEIDPLILKKIEDDVELTKEEVLMVRKITDLGDTCGCDSDHRIRDFQEQAEEERFSFTKI